MYLKNLVLISIVLSLSACSLFKTNSSTITINSPQSDVQIYLVDPVHEETLKLLGPTPLSLQSAEIGKEYYLDKRITLIAKKSGHASQMINFQTYSGTIHKFNVNLEPINWWIDKKSVEANKIVETVVSEVYKFQQAIKDGKIAEASEVCSRLLETYPSVTHFQHSMGVIKYLQKNYVSAESLFKRAIELDGDNSEAKIMLKLTQQKIKE
jgi:hypothetical protein